MVCQPLDNLTWRSCVTVCECCFLFLLLVRPLVVVWNGGYVKLFFFFCTIMREKRPRPATNWKKLSSFPTKHSLVNVSQFHLSSSLINSFLFTASHIFSFPTYSCFHENTLIQHFYISPNPAIQTHVSWRPKTLNLITPFSHRCSFHGLKSNVIVLGSSSFDDEALITSLSQSQWVLS